ncbi:MAG: choloylglycine hydrolase family protein [Bacteroidota bacterium]|nr:choloylglycine hydrolase family protein [Bacteroidota bacterium]
MNFKSFLLSVISGLLLLNVTTSNACTIFRLKAKDGSFMIVRSMEFALDMNYQVIVVPRNTPLQSPFTEESGGMKWQNKYGYVGVTSLGMTYAINDGMNEQGLAIGLLWYEADMTWQKVTPADSNIALAQAMFCDWVLGNFSSVEEVKDELPNIKVFGYQDPVSKLKPTVHFIVYDTKGDCMVIEYNEGTYKVYDNPLGIMTNAPEFPYHMQNLRNYIGMNSSNPSSHMQSKLNLKPTGHGAGFWGLPGDYTPPSRFIRLAVLTSYADQQADAKSNLNLGQHLINTFDIPFGIITEEGPGNKIYKESTQWVSFRDLAEKSFYFRTYDNFTLRKIELDKIDLSKAGIRVYSMKDSEQSIIDITEDGVSDK